jgi:hypothetical protein
VHSFSTNTKCSFSTAPHTSQTADGQMLNFLSERRELICTSTPPPPSRPRGVNKIMPACCRHFVPVRSVVYFVLPFCTLQLVHFPRPYGVRRGTTTSTAAPPVELDLRGPNQAPPEEPVPVYTPSDVITTRRPTIKENSYTNL